MECHNFSFLPLQKTKNQELASLEETLKSTTGRKHRHAAPLPPCGQMQERQLNSDPLPFFSLSDL